MDFLSCFEDIDTDFSGEITSEELEQYMTKKDFEDGFANKWLRIFDQNGDGVISIEEYCDTLGLVPNQEYICKVKDSRVEGGKRRESLINRKESRVVDNKDCQILPKHDNFRIYSIDKEMPESTKTLLLQVAREAQEKGLTAPHELAKYIKQFLDLNLEPYWHVVVSSQNHACYVSAEIGGLFHFWLLRFAFFIWKTPYY